MPNTSSGSNLTGDGLGALFISSKGELDTALAGEENAAEENGQINDVSIITDENKYKVTDNDTTETSSQPQKIGRIMKKFHKPKSKPEPKILVSDASIKTKQTTPGGLEMKIVEDVPIMDETPEQKILVKKASIDTEMQEAGIDGYELNIVGQSDVDELLPNEAPLNGDVQPVDTNIIQSKQKSCRSKSTKKKKFSVFVKKASGQYNAIEQTGDYGFELNMVEQKAMKRKQDKKLMVTEASFSGSNDGFEVHYEPSVYTSASSAGEYAPEASVELDSLLNEALTDVDSNEVSDKGRVNLSIICDDSDAEGLRSPSIDSLQNKYSFDAVDQVVPASDIVASENIATENVSPPSVSKHRKLFSFGSLRMKKSESQSVKSSDSKSQKSKTRYSVGANGVDTSADQASSARVEVDAHLNKESGIDAVKLSEAEPAKTPKHTNTVASVDLVLEKERKVEDQDNPDEKVGASESAVVSIAEDEEEADSKVSQIKSSVSKGSTKKSRDSVQVTDEKEAHDSIASHANIAEDEEEADSKVSQTKSSVSKGSTKKSKDSVQVTDEKEANKSIASNENIAEDEEEADSKLSLTKSSVSKGSTHKSIASRAMSYLSFGSSKKSKSGSLAKKTEKTEAEKNEESDLGDYQAGNDTKEKNNEAGSLASSGSPRIIGKDEDTSQVQDSFRVSEDKEEVKSVSSRSKSLSIDSSKESNKDKSAEEIQLEIENDKESSDGKGEAEQEINKSKSFTSLGSSRKSKDNAEPTIAEEDEYLPEVPDSVQVKSFVSQTASFLSIGSSKKSTTSNKDTSEKDEIKENMKKEVKQVNSFLSTGSSRKSEKREKEVEEIESSVDESSDVGNTQGGGDEKTEDEQVKSSMSRALSKKSEETQNSVQDTVDKEVRSVRSRAKSYLSFGSSKYSRQDKPEDKIEKEVELARSFVSIGSSQKSKQDKAEGLAKTEVKKMEVSNRTELIIDAFTTDGGTVEVVASPKSDRPSFFDEAVVTEKAISEGDSAKGEIAKTLKTTHVNMDTVGEGEGNAKGDNAKTLEEKQENMDMVGEGQGNAKGDYAKTLEETHENMDIVDEGEDLTKEENEEVDNEAILVDLEGGIIGEKDIKSNAMQFAVPAESQPTLNKPSVDPVTTRSSPSKKPEQIEVPAKEKVAKNISKPNVLQVGAELEQSQASVVKNPTAFPTKEHMTSHLTAINEDKVISGGMDVVQKQEKERRKKSKMGFLKKSSWKLPLNNIKEGASGSISLVSSKKSSTKGAYKRNAPIIEYGVVETAVYAASFVIEKGGNETTAKNAASVILSSAMKKQIGMYGLGRKGNNLNDVANSIALVAVNALSSGIRKDQVAHLVSTGLSAKGYKVQNIPNDVQGAFHDQDLNIQNFGTLCSFVEADESVISNMSNSINRSRSLQQKPDVVPRKDQQPSGIQTDRKKDQQPSRIQTDRKIAMETDEKNLSQSPLQGNNSGVTRSTTVQESSATQSPKKDTVGDESSKRQLPPRHGSRRKGGISGSQDLHRPSASKRSEKPMRNKTSNKNQSDDNVNIYVMRNTGGSDMARVLASALEDDDTSNNSSDILYSTTASSSVESPTSSSTS